MLYAGLDVHKDFVQACWVNRKVEVVREEEFLTNETGLNNLRSACKGSRCVMESSTACFRVYDALKEGRVKVRVAHPLMVKAIASARIKTDKIDARMLADLEKADLNPESYVPSKETRDERQLVREHCTITEEMTRAKNQSRALFLKQGVATPKNLFTKKQFLTCLEKAKGITKLSLEQSWDRLEFLGEQKKFVDELIEKQAMNNDDAILLKTIPGFGYFTAFLLAVEIDGVKRFPDAEHLTSYAGLVPSTRQSGSVTKHGGIGRGGNKRMRWVLVQAAWRALGKSKRFKSLFTRELRKGKGCKKAIVIVAKKILTTAFFMLGRRQAFKENA